ncbi:unnamed protein product [Durusdinium trenchii]|uniref:Uncharacterized protein n=1 Tax=Durusdinium trenchii TaxID=1381693 RepID=A0ABP0T183_9DINO
MNTTIREKLEEAVRRYGMRAFIYHDVIARECFSRGYSSVTPGMEAWAKQLTNSSKDTDPLVSLFLDRVINDFKRSPPDIRKPLNYKDALGKHQACGAYIHFKAMMQSTCPEGEWADLSKELDTAFYDQFLDADLLSALQSSVPPGDVGAIGAMRQCHIKL